MLGGLLADLKDTIHAWDIAGRRLDKPLLILIDEAGQLELGWLPSEVSTIAALGAFFVTCWQNLAQIHHRYGTLADAVLSGHRTKCFFAGIDDLTTTRYLTRLLGPEYVTRTSTSNDVPTLCGGRNGRPAQHLPGRTRVEFAPPNTVRQMIPGEAVLLHGTLPPIHLEAVRWWAQKELAALVPLDDDGHPNPPDDLPTCPLGPEAPAAENPDVDEATLVSTLAELANIGKKKSSGPRTRGGPGPGQMTLPDATSNPAPPSPSPSPASAAPSPRSRRLQLVPSLGQDPAVKDSTPSGVGDPPPPARNPVRRRTPCMSCGVILRVGEGDTRVDPDSGADISVCWPACHLPSRAPTTSLTRRPDEPIVRVAPSDRIPRGQPMHRTLRPLTLAAFAATTVAAQSPVASASPTPATEPAAATPTGPAPSAPTPTPDTAPTDPALADPTPTPAAADPSTPAPTPTESTPTTTAPSPATTVSTPPPRGRRPDTHHGSG